MLSFTFLAAVIVLLMVVAAGTIVGWWKGPLAGMAAGLAVLMTGLLGYVSLVTLASGM